MRPAIIPPLALAFIAAVGLYGACSDEHPVAWPKSQPAPGGALATPKPPPAPAPGVAPAADRQVASSSEVDAIFADGEPGELGDRSAPPDELVAVELPPELLLPHDGDCTAVSHLAQGRLALAGADESAAVRSYRMALFHEPASLDAVKGIARAARRGGDLESARRALALWSALDVADATPLVKLAHLELAAGEDGRAGELANQALARDLGNADAYHLKGRVLFRKDELAAATAAFESAVELDPGHAHAFNNLGLCYLRAGQWQLAVEALTAATLLAPDVAHMHNNLGLAYEKVGYTTEALAEYRTAVVLRPRYGNAAANLQRLSRVAEARVPGTRPGFAPASAREAAE